MGPNPTKIAGGAALVAALLVPNLAVAQWNDQPYQFRNSPGAGAGMSVAYRQAMLIQEIENRRPNSILRGADGTLTEVQRFRRQAFAITPEPDYLPTITRPWGTVRGIGMGGAGIAIQAWTLQISDDTVSTYAGTTAPSPIDSWVGMLD